MTRRSIAFFLLLLIGLPGCRFLRTAQHTLDTNGVVYDWHRQGIAISEDSRMAAYQGTHGTTLRTWHGGQFVGDVDFGDPGEFVSLISKAGVDHRGAFLMLKQTDGPAGVGGAVTFHEPRIVPSPGTPTRFAMGEFSSDDLVGVLEGETLTELCDFAAHPDWGLVFSARVTIGSLGETVGAVFGVGLFTEEYNMRLVDLDFSPIHRSRIYGEEDFLPGDACLTLDVDATDGEIVLGGDAYLGGGVSGQKLWRFNRDMDLIAEVPLAGEGEIIDLVAHNGYVAVGREGAGVDYAPIEIADPVPTFYGSGLNGGFSNPTVPQLGGSLLAGATVENGLALARIEMVYASTGVASDVLHVPGIQALAADTTQHYSRRGSSDPALDCVGIYGFLWRLNYDVDGTPGDADSRYHNLHRHTVCSD